MKKPFLLILPLYFIACTNAADRQAKEDEKEQETEVVYEQENIPQFNQYFPEAFAFLQEQDSSFNAGKFTTGEVVSRDSFPPHPLDSSLMRDYGQFLVYNNDSTLALDLASYNFIRTNRKGKTSYEFAGPDTEIGLVDLAARTRKRILFLGAAGLVLDGKFENNETIILAGAEEAGEGALRPIIWRYNIRTSEMEAFSYPGTINARIGNFYDRKYNSPIRTTRVV